MTPYTIVLTTHNLMRWVVLILAVVALVRAYSGWLGGRAWTDRERRIGSAFGMVLDVQFLIGLLLYFFFSPLTQSALQDFGQAMANPELRFFALEHTFYMIVAVVLVHVGSVLARRAEPDAAKFRRAAIFYTLAVLVILIAIPWSRPLIRLG